MRNINHDVRYISNLKAKIGRMITNYKIRQEYNFCNDPESLHKYHKV